MATHSRVKIGISLVTAVVVLGAVSLPYLYAQRAATPGYVFGGFLLNPIDGNSYLAKMYQGWRGEWRFTLPYTAEPGEGVFLFPLYILLGHLSRVFGVSLNAVFHGARFVGVVVLLWQMYRFFLWVFPERPGLRTSAFALAALGGGLGWVALPFGAVTSDFWVAETYPFLSSYVNPHFPLSLAALIFLFRRGHDISMDPSPRRMLVLLLVSFVLALLSPFGVAIGVAVLGGMALLSRKQWLIPAILAAAGGGAVLVYDLWVTRVHPALAGWNAQNLTATPPWWDLLLSLSPALPFALYGTVSILFQRAPARDDQAPGKRTGEPLLLLAVWAITGLMMVLLPFGLQRRFLMGLYIPLVGLACQVVWQLAERLRRNASILLTLVFALSLPTNLLILLTANHGVQTRDPLLYLRRGEADALEWIEDNSTPRALVLASPEMGMYIPSHTGRRVLYGHPFETVDADAERGRIEEFFRSTMDEQEGLLQSQNVDLVFYGPREQELGEIQSQGAFTKVYSKGGVEIYAPNGVAR